MRQMKSRRVNRTGFAPVAGFESILGQASGLFVSLASSFLTILDTRILAM